MVGTIQKKSEIDKVIDANSLIYLKHQSLTGTTAILAKRDWSNGAKWMYNNALSANTESTDSTLFTELKSLLEERKFVEKDKANVNEVDRIVNNRYIAIINLKIKKLLSL